MGLNGLLEEMEEGDEGEAISSGREFAALKWVWPMGSLLETEIERERGEGGEGIKVQNRLTERPGC